MPIGLAISTTFPVAGPFDCCVCGLSIYTWAQYELKMFVGVYPPNINLYPSLRESQAFRLMRMVEVTRVHVILVYRHYL